MKDHEADISTSVTNDAGTTSGKSVSRREFLRLAGIAGVAVGVGGSLGGVLAGCGEDAETTTTAAPEFMTTVATKESVP
jgi:hypothetical protein